MTESPPTSSIIVLQDAIAASAFRIAPEKEQELAQWRDLAGFSLKFTEEPGFAIRVNTESHEAKLPIAALEFLWASAHAFFVFHQEYVAAQQARAKTLDFGGSPRIRTAAELLSWSIENLDLPGKCVRPTNAPRPEQSPSYGTDSHVANELFLCAIAWIIHHEIGHVALSHGQGHPSLIVQQEQDADRHATEWILSQSTVVKERQKRVLGIATAILAMHLLDTTDRDGNRLSHPPSLERLDDALQLAGVDDNGVECAFCSVALHFNLARNLVNGPLDGESIRDVLRQQIIAFMRRNII